jgi:hypothetical protein
MKFRFDFWDVLPCKIIIALMMEAARTCETSVDNYFTRQYIPEDKSELHIRRRENLKSHILYHVQHSTLFSRMLRELSFVKNLLKSNIF